MTTDKDYSITPYEGYVVVKINSQTDHSSSKKWEEEIENLLGTHYFLVDCKDLSDISPDWIRTLLKIQGTLKENKKFLKLVRVNSFLASFLRKQGIDSSLTVSKDIREALAETGLAPKRKLNTEFINPFLKGTINTLKVQADVECKAGKVFVKKPKDIVQGDISGVIGIVSDSFKGSIVITFSEKVFLQIISSMLGEEYKKLDNEIIDGAGELTNMIFGQAKVELNDLGYGIKTAIPSVVLGKDHSLSGMTKEPVVIVPFETKFGMFYVEICLSDE